MKRLLVLLLLCALAAPAVSCGKKGDPRAPEDVKDTYPRKYPQ